MSPLPRRLRSFSLRTLMVLVGVCAVAGGFVAHDWRIVGARKAAIKEYLRLGSAVDRQFHGQESPATVSWLRQLLGDQPIELIGLPQSTGDAVKDRAADLFPEANVVRMSEWIGSSRPPLRGGSKTAIPVLCLIAGAVVGYALATLRSWLNTAAPPSPPASTVSS